MIHNDIMKIIQTSLDEPYEYGKNDCNLVVLKMIDLINGSTTLSIREYSSIKEGIQGLKDEGWNHTGEIVENYCDEVTHTIDGDIWLDDENPLIMAVVASDRILAVDEDHQSFKLQKKPKHGRYFRVRKGNG